MTIMAILLFTGKTYDNRYGGIHLRIQHSIERYFFVKIIYFRDETITFLFNLRHFAK